MTTQTETQPYGVLGTLSPEMAKDIGDAFSLKTIGAAGALRLASRAAAFISVTAFAVAVTATALYLMRL